MRQFDVFVWGGKTEIFTDSALGWFFTENFNEKLAEIDAEWIVFSKNDILINRDFLNSLAQRISEFPMVDAFAPRIRTNLNNTQKTHFSGGFILDKKHGLSMIDENAPLRFVASPNPDIAVFSRRIIQRTGLFDSRLPLEFQIIDFSLRMLHAGGKCFSIPYLVCEKTSSSQPFSGFQNQLNNLAYALQKAFGIKNSNFLFKHPSVISFIWKNRKEIDTKRNKAILLSKLARDFIKEIS